MIGYIYKIINDINDNVYIGSTRQSLCNRMNNHRHNYKNAKKQTKLYVAINEIGVNHFKIILVEEVDVPDRQHLLKYEDKYIREYNSVQTGYNGIYAHVTIEQKRTRKNTFNNTEVNKKKIQAYKKQYYQLNKEMIKTRISNNQQGKCREKYLKYQNEYHEKNKEIAQVKAKEYYTQNKVKCALANKNYRLNNIEKCKAYSREWHKKKKVTKN
jgi:hypothetical protein